MKKTAIFVFFIFCAFCAAEEKYAGYKLIGYVPIWNSGGPVYTIESGLKKIDFSKFTHTIISFIYSDRDGNLSYYNNYESGNWSPEAASDSIISMSKLNNSKVLISLGSSDDGWEMTKNPEARTNFASNIKKFLIEKQLDGLDLDLEGGWDDSSPFYSDEYALLAQELRDSLGNDFYLTAAIGAKQTSWKGDTLWTKDFLKVMDWVNIMVYDLHLWGGTDIQNPSAFQDQIDAANEWSKYLNKEKLVFGVPFYSNGWNYDDNIRYANEICWWITSDDSSTWTWYSKDQFNYWILDSLFTPDAGADSILVSKEDKLWIDIENSYMGFRGSHNGIIYLNGRTLLKEKSKWAIENGYGGIMIWEASCDVATNHPRSLLAALSEQFYESTQNISSHIISKNTKFTSKDFSFYMQNRTLRISLETANPAKIIISDSRGRILFSQTANTKEISLAINKKRFADGVYQLTVSQNNVSKSVNFLLK